MKKPSIKSTNRAYVRLHTYVTKRQDWEEFVQTYRVVLDSNGSEELSNCFVKVYTKMGELAALGPNIPNQITFSLRKEPPMSIWTEFFNDGKFNWRNVSCR